MTRIRCVNSADLLESLSIPYVDLPRQVTETGDTEKSSLRVVGEEVSRLGSEIVDEVNSSVENDSFGWHDCNARPISYT